MRGKFKNSQNRDRRPYLARFEVIASISSVIIAVTSLIFSYSQNKQNSDFLRNQMTANALQIYAESEVKYPNASSCILLIQNMHEEELVKIHRKESFSLDLLNLAVDKGALARCLDPDIPINGDQIHLPENEVRKIYTSTYYKINEHLIIAGYLKHEVVNRTWLCDELAVQQRNYIQPVVKKLKNSSDPVLQLHYSYIKNLDGFCLEG